MNTEVEDSTFGQQMINLEIAAAKLLVSQRYLKELMIKNGYSVFHLGPKQQRISEDDYRALLRLTSTQP